jgi:hypothetical protein
MTWTLEHCPANEEWSKTFSTKEEAVAELLKHICSCCMSGMIDIVDSKSESGLTRERLCDPPDPTSAYDLLSTPCGCEYDLSEDEAAK